MKITTNHTLDSLILTAAWVAIQCPVLSYVGMLRYGENKIDEQQNYKYENDSNQSKTIVDNSTARVGMFAWLQRQPWDE